MICHPMPPRNPNEVWHVNYRHADPRGNYAARQFFTRQKSTIFPRRSIFYSSYFAQKIKQKICRDRSRNPHLLLAKQGRFVDTLRQKD